MQRSKPRRRDPQLGVVTFEEMRRIFAQQARTCGAPELTRKQLKDHWVTLELDADVDPQPNPPGVARPVHRTASSSTAMVPASGSVAAGFNTTVPAWSSTAMVPAWSPTASGSASSSVAPGPEPQLLQQHFQCACCSQVTRAPRPPEAPPPGFEAVLACTNCTDWVEHYVNNGFDLSTSFHNVRAWHQR